MNVSSVGNKRPISEVSESSNPFAERISVTDLASQSLVDLPMQDLERVRTPYVWTPLAEFQLQLAVQEYRGRPISWAKIAREIFTNSVSRKSIRNHYYNFLAPNLISSPVTERHKYRIVLLYNQYNLTPAEIKKIFQENNEGFSYSESAIKNIIYSVAFIKQYPKALEWLSQIKMMYPEKEELVILANLRQEEDLLTEKVTDVQESLPISTEDIVENLLTEKVTEVQESLPISTEDIVENLLTEKVTEVQESLPISTEDIVENLLTEKVTEVQESLPISTEDIVENLLTEKVTEVQESLPISTEDIVEEVLPDRASQNVVNLPRQDLKRVRRSDIWTSSANLQLQQAVQKYRGRRIFWEGIAQEVFNNAVSGKNIRDHYYNFLAPNLIFSSATEQHKYQILLLRNVYNLTPAEIKKIFQENNQGVSYSESVIKNIIYSVKCMNQYPKALEWWSRTKMMHPEKEELVVLANLRDSAFSGNVSVNIDVDPAGSLIDKDLREGGDPLTEKREKVQESLSISREDIVEDVSPESWRVSLEDEEMICLEEVERVWHKFEEFTSEL